MKWRETAPERRLRLIAAAVLIAGFASAILTYLTARSEPGNPLGYEPEDSKRYLREMEVYGGKANVLASDLRHWFFSLWHGQRLAFTLACLAMILAGAFWFVAARLPSDLDGSAAGGSERGAAP